MLTPAAFLRSLGLGADCLRLVNSAAAQQDGLTPLAVCPFLTMSPVPQLFCFRYHTFMPISAATAHRWRRADLCLVIVLNIACNYSLTYFTIGSQAALGLTALACMSGGMGIYSIINMQQASAIARTLPPSAASCNH